MVLLTQFRLEKAVRISRPFCRLPRNAQNLHQPTYSHLLPELDAEPLPHEHARTQSPEVCCIMRGQPSTRCEWLAWLKRIVARSFWPSSNASPVQIHRGANSMTSASREIGRASCRERV